MTEREREPLFITLIHSRVIFFFFFFCLALSYNAHLSIDVHCSNGAKKKKRFSSTTGAFFLGV